VCEHTHLAVGLLTLGRDGVDLVDEDDGRGVLLGLLEGLWGGWLIDGWIGEMMVD
jgi:hypothetical protein